jgi:tricorn protease
MLAREFTTGLALLAALSAPAGNVRLAATPALTPDGSTLVFEWQEDLWTVPVAGGQARALTRHPALDRFPVVSPDGKSVAFMSNRDSTYQTWIIPLESGEARQVTRHSEGSGPQDWFPDGRRLIVRGARDSGDFLASRFFAVDADGAKAERQLFDEPGEWARVSPDGGRILYMHGGDSVYRRGYRGSLAATIWMHDLAANTFTNAARSADGAECRWPLWRPDGKGFYFVREDASRASNLWEKDLATGEERQRTFLAPPGVFFPGISRDGSVVVFRSGFDFYRWSPADPAEPSLIQITAPPDSAPAATSRLTLTRADNHDTPGSVSFNPEGDEVLFTTGGDLWVMDTELREPVAITRGSDAQDAWAFFAPGASNTVYFLRDTGDRCNLWKAERADPSLPWWRNGAFTLTALTDDARGRTRMSSDPRRHPHRLDRTPRLPVDRHARQQRRRARLRLARHGRLLVVARRQMARLLRRGQRRQPRRLDRVGRRRPPARQHFPPPRLGRQSRVVARRPLHRLGGAPLRRHLPHPVRPAPQRGPRPHPPRPRTHAPGEIRQGREVRQTGEKGRRGAHRLRRPGR